MGAAASTTYYQCSGGGGGGASVVRVSRSGAVIKQFEATGGGGGGATGRTNVLLPADGGSGGSWSTSFAGGIGGGGLDGKPGVGSQYIDGVLQGSGGFPSNGNGSASITIYYIVPS